MGEGHTEREREGIPSRLHTVHAEPNVGLEPTNCEIVTWAKIKSWMLNWLSHSGITKSMPCFFCFLFFVFNFWRLFSFKRERERERETECKQGRARERGRHRIGSRPQAVSCQHKAGHGARTHKLWDHDLSRSWTFNQLSHLGPLALFFKNVYLFRKRESMHVGRGGAERERERERECPLSVQSATSGSISRTRRSWPEPN